MNLQFIRLRTKLIIATTFLILIPILIVGIYSYNEFEKVLAHNIADATSERLHQININIETELKSMMNASSSVVLDEHIRDVLNQPPTSDRETLDNVNQIDKKILEISTAIITDSVYITIIDNYGNFYTNWTQEPESYERIFRSAFYEKAMELNGYMTWEMNHPNYVDPKGENLVTLSMAIRDNNSSKNIGILVISEPSSTYLDILRNGYLGNMGFILDKDGQILTKDVSMVEHIFPSIEKELKYRNDQFSYSIQEEKVEVFTNHIPLTEWLIVQIVPDKSIYNQITSIRNNAIAILLISLTVFVLLIIFLSTMFTRSLKKLQLTMNQVEAGDLNVAFNLNSRDEVGLLGKSFSKMLKRVRYHIDNEIILERSKEQAKLEALQAQINPHFLHNTINSIKMMSIMAGTKNITEMLLSLGHLLNMSIHRGQELITVEEEMMNVRSFMTIQKYRFGDTIEVIEQMDSEALDALVPKLSLQPLVENVYQHGLFIHGGTMTISIEKKAEDIFLKITDNGETPSEKRLLEVNKQLDSNPSQPFSSIGLQNVHKRIQMMFGSSYGLTIERIEEKSSTCVTIHLPYRRVLDEIASSRD